MQPFGTLKGFGVTFKHIFTQADHAAVPGVQAARLPALPRPAPPPPSRERAREVRRLLALRGRVPVRLHPRRRRREHRRAPRLRRRAVRAHLRDQPLALHLLRLLRARLPVRRDHARQRVRALRVLARRPDLHEGHAPRRADQADPGAGPGPLRHADPRLQVVVLMGNFLVWVIWLLAAGACVATGLRVDHGGEPVLVRALADRQPRVARGALPPRLRGVRRRGAGPRLRRRGDGHVPLRDRVPRRPRGRAVGRRDARSSRRRP